MTEQTAPVVRKNANWLMLLGILLVVLGVIGLGMEVSLTIGSVLFFWLSHPCWRDSSADRRRQG